MKNTKALFIIGVLMMLSACSSPESGSGSRASKESDLSLNPCDLFTIADAQVLFPGYPISVIKNETKPNQIGMKICFYSASDTDQRFAQLALTSAEEAPDGIVEGNSLRPLYESELELLDPKNIKEVPGLGTAAYFGGTGLKPGAGLHVLDDVHGLKFDVTVGLGFGNSDETAHLNAEKTIVEKALSRL